MTVRYPQITVKLSGHGGNAHAILGKVIMVLTRYGVSQAEVELFETEATASNYPHLLKTCREWVIVT